jgi:hypothetical protein
LALDTPAAAEHLIEFYRSQGFREVEEVQWPQRSYRSQVLSKPLDAAASSAVPRHRMLPRRHSAWYGVMVSR